MLVARSAITKLKIKTQMKHIFYFFTIFAIMAEMYSFIETKRFHDFINRFKKESKEKKFDDWSSSQKIMCFWMPIYILWTLCGLFTFQWEIFLFLITIGMISKKWVWYRKIDSLITILVLIFIILNAYHFKIDIWNLIMAF